jgi:murein DD-endopeptidase MepM/ murein hydrolase activator NlpD
MSQRRTSVRPRVRPPLRRGARRVLVALMAGVVLAGTAAPAAAAPPTNPSDEQIDSARSAKEKAAAEVGRITALVADAESELQRLSYQAEAAGAAYLQAEEALAQAQAAADRTAAQLAAAARRVAAAEGRIADFSRDSYMNGSTLTSPAALLDAAGPGELVRRAAILDWVADKQVDVLGQLEIAKVQQANADSAARQARDEMAAAEEAAEAAKVAADQQVAAQQGAYEAVAAKKADYDKQLRQAQITLLELQGARDAYREWLRQKAAAEERAAAEAARQQRAAEEAAREARENAAHGGGGGGSGVGSSGVGGGGGGRGYVRPTGGYISSCYGWRWGALHAGVDIAAPIGTPIYAATSGIVQRTGPATGFGLAVYIRGDDGAVTVYGHVNQEFVSAGQRVSTGQVIAEVGNRGNSTGPHLHFEVHPWGAMYGGSTDPVPWLRGRGVAMEAC